jgi:hypothetical protein
MGSELECRLIFRIMKKIIFTLTITMLALRSPAPTGIISPILDIVYNSTDNTVTITQIGGTPNRTMYLSMLTDLTNTNWTDLSSFTVSKTGIYVFTNIPGTNLYAFFRTHY